VALPGVVLVAEVEALGEGAEEAGVGAGTIVTEITDVGEAFLLLVYHVISEHSKSAKVIFC